MATTIRELTARLGFEFDATPATRFDAAMKRSKRNLEGLNKVKLDRFRRRILKTFKLISAAAAVTFGTALAGFLKFSEETKAVTQLEFQLSKFPGAFKAIKKEMDAILADPLIGKLTTELQLLNAATGALAKGVDPGVVTRLLKPALQFATVNRESIQDVIGAITEFLESGSLDLLKKLGVVTQAQAEVFKKTDIGPSAQGLIQRKAFIENTFAALIPQFEQSLRKLAESGAVSQQQLLNTLSELLKDIGEATAPLFKKLNAELIIFIDTIREFVRGRVFQVIRGEITTQEFLFPKKDVEAKREKIREQGRKAIETEQEKIREQGRRVLEFLEKFFITGFRQPEIGGFRGNNNKSGAINNNSDTQNITVNNTINIAPGASGDPVMIERAVNTGMRKVLGTVVDQSKRTTLVHGGS